MNQAKKETVKVFVRLRPPSEQELNSDEFEEAVVINGSKNEVAVDRSFEVKRFHYNGVLPPNVSQQEVFDRVCCPLVDDSFEGYHGTCFAYGQSGTGKTFTLANVNVGLEGVIPQAVDRIFDRINREGDEYECEVVVNYIQIYMEMIQDLLRPGSKNMQIREDPSSGVFIRGVKDEVVTCRDELMKLFDIGNEARVVALTNLNAESSRSHACLIVKIRRSKIVTVEEQLAEEEDQESYTNRTTSLGKLTLVDLAGSERVKKSKAAGQRQEEAKAINLSLSALGNVIHALTDERASHVPFRDSKLTRLLQDSLGGSGKTRIVVTIGPAKSNVHETVSSLLFGSRAMKVVSSVQKSEIIDYRALSIKLQSQLDTLGDQIHEFELELSVRTEERDSALKELQDDSHIKAVLEGDKKEIEEQHQKYVKKLVESYDAQVDEAMRDLEEEIRHHELDVDYYSGKSSSTEDQLKKLESELRTNEEAFTSRVEDLTDERDTLLLENDRIQDEHELLMRKHANAFEHLKLESGEELGIERERRMRVEARMHSIHEQIAGIEVPTYAERLSKQKVDDVVDEFEQYEGENETSVVNEEDSEDDDESEEDEEEKSSGESDYDVEFEDVEEKSVMDVAKNIDSVLSRKQEELVALGKLYIESQNKVEELQQLMESEKENGESLRFQIDEASALINTHISSYSEHRFSDSLDLNSKVKNLVDVVSSHFDEENRKSLLTKDEKWREKYSKRVRRMNDELGHVRAIYEEKLRLQVLEREKVENESEETKRLMDKQLSEMEGKLERQIFDSDERQVEMNEKLDNLTKKIEEWEERESDLQKEIDDGEERINVLTNDLNDRSSNLKQCVEDISKLEEEVRIFTEKYEKVSEEKKKILSSFENMRKHLELCAKKVERHVESMEEKAKCVYPQVFEIESSTNDSSSNDIFTNLLLREMNCEEEEEEILMAVDRYRELPFPSHVCQSSESYFLQRSELSNSTVKDDESQRICCAILSETVFSYLDAYCSISTEKNEDREDTDCLLFVPERIHILSSHSTVPTVLSEKIESTDFESRELLFTEQLQEEMEGNASMILSIASDSFLRRLQNSVSRNRMFGIINSSLRLIEKILYRWHFDSTVQNVQSHALWHFVRNTRTLYLNNRVLLRDLQDSQKAIDNWMRRGDDLAKQGEDEARRRRVVEDESRLLAAEKKFLEEMSARTGAFFMAKGFKELERLFESFHEFFVEPRSASFASFMENRVRRRKRKNTATRKEEEVSVVSTPFKLSSYGDSDDESEMQNPLARK